MPPSPSSAEEAPQHQFWCPTFAKEGTLKLSHPANEVCPICEREKGFGAHQCNFVLKPANA